MTRRVFYPEERLPRHIPVMFPRSVFFGVNIAKGRCFAIAAFFPGDFLMNEKTRRGAFPWNHNAFIFYCLLCGLYFRDDRYFLRISSTPAASQLHHERKTI